MLGARSFSELGVVQDLLVFEVGFFDRNTLVLDHCDQLVDVQLRQRLRCRQLRSLHL